MCPLDYNLAPYHTTSAADTSRGVSILHIFGVFSYSPVISLLFIWYLGVHCFLLCQSSGTVMGVVAKRECTPVGSNIWKFGLQLVEYLGRIWGIIYWRYVTSRRGQGVDFEVSEVNVIPVGSLCLMDVAPRCDFWATVPALCLPSYLPCFWPWSSLTDPLIL